MIHQLHYLKSNFSQSVLHVVTADDSYELLFTAIENQFENEHYMDKILTIEMLTQHTTKIY